ncbi:unnamed protein product [Camellia sinensis]
MRNQTQEEIKPKPPPPPPKPVILSSHLELLKITSWVILLRNSLLPIDLGLQLGGFSMCLLLQCARDILKENHTVGIFSSLNLVCKFQRFIPFKASPRFFLLTTFFNSRNFFFEQKTQEIKPKGLPTRRLMLFHLRPITCLLFTSLLWSLKQTFETFQSKQ